jgi:AraC-like DNA-binding protein
MFRTSNEEQVEQSVQALHAFVPEENATRRMRLLGGNPADSASAIATVPYARGGLPPRVVRRLREHIDSNIDQRVSVDAMAKLANLSVCYFVRAFKQSVGLTPHDYLIRRRVERTMQLLSGTDMSPLRRKRVGDAAHPGGRGRTLSKHSLWRSLKQSTVRSQQRMTTILFKTDSQPRATLRQQ